MAEAGPSSACAQEGEEVAVDADLLRGGPQRRRPQVLLKRDSVDDEFRSSDEDEDLERAPQPSLFELKRARRLRTRW